MKNLLYAFAAAALVAACSPDSSMPAAGPMPSGNLPWSAAFDATTFGWLLNVWGPSDDVLYAVGGTEDEGRVKRFDGGAWQDVAVGLDVPLLNWAFGFGPQEFWVVGNEGTIIRYDGQWTQTATVTDENLWGVWGAAPDDLWAVGGSGRPDGQATLLRYDGSAWRRIETPPLSRSGVNAFFKVWGTAADNVYIVGQRGALLRWDGAQFEEIPAGTGNDLIALWGTGPDRIVVVGGRANGEALTWDGVEWKRYQLVPRPGLNGVWMRNPDVAHLVGVNGSILRFDFATGQVEDDTPREVALDFHAVFGPPGGERMVAVGGDFEPADGVFEGVAYERTLTDGD